MILKALLSNTFKIIVQVAFICVFHTSFILFVYRILACTVNSICMEGLGWNAHLKALLPTSPYLTKDHVQKKPEIFDEKRGNAALLIKNFGFYFQSHYIGGDVFGGSCCAHH